MSAALNVAAPVRLALDAAALERCLGQPMLMLVELVRRLMEAQAERRLEAGTFTAKEGERLGCALLQLRAAVEGFCGRLGLAPEELNLDLGPLGRLP